MLELHSSVHVHDFLTKCSSHFFGDVGGKRFLNAAERRRLKKNGTLDVLTPPEPKKAPKDVQSQPKAPVQPSIPRGKRTKLQRMKKKYADQDDEERELALRVLGAAEVTPAGAKTSPTDASNSKETADVVKGEAENNSHEDGKTGTDVDGKEREDVLRTNEEEGIIDLASLEAETIAALDSLTALPTEKDIILHAIPVCAPYNVMSEYKYKVKLLPGALKRGKAYQQALSYYTYATTPDEAG